VRVATAWFVALVAAATAEAELPPGWTVHTFAGRIRDIDTQGGVVTGASDGGLLFLDPQSGTFAPVLADAGCQNGDCLPSNRLSSVVRDAAGTYWIGTVASGAVSFHPAASGRKFNRFFALNTAPGGDLLADSVACIATAGGGQIYVGTSRGVARIDVVGAVESHNPDAARLLGTDLAGTRIAALAVDADFVWVGTDSGASRYARQPPYAVQRLRTGLQAPPVHALEILDGVVYAGTNVGVFTWDEGTSAWSRLNCGGCPPPPNFVARSIARRAAAPPDDWLFVGSDTDVFIYSGFFWGPLSPPPLPTLVGTRRFDVMAAQGDTIWTCQTDADDAAAFYDRWVTGPTPAGTWTRVVPNAPPRSEVRCLSLSQQGALWAGTHLGGVGRLAPAGDWCIYDASDPIVRVNMDDPAGQTSMILADLQGDVWFHAIPTTELADTVDVLTPDPTCNHAAEVWRKRVPDEDGLLGRYWAARLDAEGHRYLLSDGDRADGEGGFDIISSNGQQVLNIRSNVLGPGGNSVGALAFNTTSVAWSTAYVGLNGVAAEGLLRWTRSDQLFPPQRPPEAVNFRPMALPDSIDVGAYRDIVVVPGTQLLWVGTDNGILEYDAATQQLLSPPLRTKLDARPGLLSGDVKDLQLDKYGNLWIATGKGLNRLRLDRRTPGQTPPIEAFTTIEAIRELNSASGAGQIYDPRRSLAPLPHAAANALAYDAGRDRLFIATQGGIAAADVGLLSRPAAIPLDQAVLYPNPVRLSAGHSEVRLAHVGEPATVTVFTLEGQEVCTVTDREDGDIVWTLGTPSCLESEGNFKAASGAYLVRIATASGTTMRTLVIVR
jgi:hypothetical protein